MDEVAETDRRREEGYRREETIRSLLKRHDHKRLTIGAVGRDRSGGRPSFEEKPSNVRIFLRDILTFNGFFGAVFDILTPKWPPTVYSATKAGVIALTQAMGLELAPFGVLVNSICPGTMNTDQARFTFRSRAAKVGRSVEELWTEKERAMPLGRLGSPKDAAAMVAWLASDEATFTVGAAFNLTGGEFVAF